MKIIINSIFDKSYVLCYNSITTIVALVKKS